MTVSQSLSGNIVVTSVESEKNVTGNMIFQGNLLLFYLRGEIQKLRPHVSQSQRAEFDIVCKKMEMAVCRASREADDTAFEEIVQDFRNVYEKLVVGAEKLGIYGTPIQFIAEEILRIAG